MPKVFRLNLWFLLLFLGALWSGWLHGQAEQQAGPSVLLLEVRGPIGPATSDYVRKGLERSREAQAQLVILRMDTPGGLDTSMRDIIRAIIESPVPVATYVAPGGARAASAGTYILYASHIAVMAPGTNLGAATPVQMGGPGGGEPQQPKPADPVEKKDKSKGEGKDESEGKDSAQEQPAPAGDAMKRKMVNDAVAYIRSLAELRGRNAEWAEKAVRGAASLPAHEAVEMKVADFMAENVAELLEKADGRSVKIQGAEQTLASKGLAVETFEPDWRNRLLQVITNPNVAYILMLIGVYGLIFEFANPGFIVPGVAGAICLVLALYSFHVLPINYAGLALMGLGIIFMVAEAFAPSFGALGIGGVIAFVAGSIILMDTESEFFTISLPLIFAVAAITAGLMIGILGMAVRARSRPVVSGWESLVGDTGEAVDSFEGRGRVRVQGEIWSARAEVPIEQGQRIRVQAVDGLILDVKPE